MYNPYNDPFNKQNPGESGFQWNAPESGVPTEWNGSTYHSGPQTGQGGGMPPEKKPPRKTPRWVKTAVLCACCVAVSVGGSVGISAAIFQNSIPTAASDSAQANQTDNSSSSANASSQASGEDSSGRITQTTNTTAAQQLTQQEVAAKVIPSVVCIQTYSSTEAAFGFGSTETKQGEGSGVIATSDGYIITNAHVVSGADSIKVILSDNTTYEAELIGSDATTDLAVIKIDATGLQAAEFGSSSQLQVADTVMAIGNPGGLEFQSSVSVGCISALDRVVTNSESYTMKCIQTDAAINPGNSGGALVNMYGQVIGINSSKLVDTSYEGMGFAIPIDDALPIINDLREFGYVKDRPVLGISGQFVDTLTAYYNRLSATGYYVAEISSEAVSAAGLQQGDIIVEIDGKTVTSSNVISSAIAAKETGDTVSVVVVRGSQEITLTLPLSEYTPSTDAAANS